MKEKSAMKKLIDSLKTTQKQYEFYIEDADSKHESITMIAFNKGIAKAIELAESLLADEKKQIVEAYTNAQVEITSVIVAELRNKNVDLSNLSANFIGDFIFDTDDKEDGITYYSSKFED